MHNRLLYFFGFCCVCLLLLTSIYWQLYKGMVPCPLCSLQRFAFAVLGIWFLIGFVFQKKWMRNVINMLLILTTCTGLFFAGRQIWLQHFPPVDNTECGVSLQYMMQVLPWQEVFSKVFTGTAECTQRGFEFLSLNMAEWAFVWFVFFLGLSLYLLKKTICRKN